MIQNREGASGGNGVLTVDNTSDYTFAGHFRNGGSGTLSLVKDGSGTLTFKNAPGQTTRVNYTGATAVKEGQLALVDATIYNSPTTVESARSSPSAAPATCRITRREPPFC